MKNIKNWLFNRKKKILWFTIIILILIVLTSKISCSQIFEVNINWKLSLPLPDKNIYCYDKGLASAYTYCIDKYRSKLKIDRIINSFEWKTVISDVELDEISRIFLEIEVPKEYKINLNDDYLFYSILRDDNVSKLYVIYLEEEQVLYTLELNI